MICSTLDEGEEEKIYCTSHFNNVCTTYFNNDSRATKYLVVHDKVPQIKDNKFTLLQSINLGTIM